MTAHQDLNLGRVIAAVAEQVPERIAVIQGAAALTYRDLVERSTRLAIYLNSRGIGHIADRAHLKNHQAGQALMGQLLYNGAAYIEGLVGGFVGRIAPFNVNYRYLGDELRYLFTDAGPAVIQYHAAFAPLLTEVLPHLTPQPLLLQVADSSGHPLIEGAVDYEDALNSIGADQLSSTSLLEHLSPDDLYVIYTGGTTGMPKGVLWRQGDVAVSTMGLRDRRRNREWASEEELAAALRPTPNRVVPCAPMMHGAAQWAALGFLGEGNTIVFPEKAESFAPEQVLRAVEQHGVTAITIVGDAFALPLIEVLDRGRYDVSSLRVVVSGGAALHAGSKQRLIESVPRLRVVENIGSSESGILGSRHSEDAAGASDSSFAPDTSMAVVNEDMTAFLTPGHDGTGWLARRGRIPLGYLGDAEKTARTFPVVEGERVSIPGDRAQLLANGQVRLLGRDSLTVNTGGEKVFVEEVEAVLKDHPAVSDALVCGRPSNRWGSEIAAVVVAERGTRASDLIDFCRAHLARYKVPKDIVFVDQVARTETGKPDYEWATTQVSASHDQQAVPALKQ